MDSNETVQIGSEPISGACAIGPNATVLVSDGIALRCDCGLVLDGVAAPGTARTEGMALYRDHATRCGKTFPRASLPR